VIAFNLAADARRINARATPMDEPLFGEAALGPNQCEEHVLRAERAAELHEVLAGLPPRQREVIIARDVEGRRPGEIAASLGLSLGAVDSLLLRARRRMALLWHTGGAEHGATTTQVTTASLAATTAVIHHGVVEAVASRAQQVLSSVSYHLAAGMGLLPGRQPIVSRLAAMAAAGAVVAAPVAMVVTPSAHTTAPAPPATVTLLKEQLSHVDRVTRAVRTVVDVNTGVGTEGKAPSAVTQLLTSVSHLQVAKSVKLVPVVHRPAQRVSLITTLLQDVDTLLGRHVGG
jgi:hypothetical protein